MALVAALAEQLAVDPPFLLWAACVAWRRDALMAKTTAEVAAWLAANALSVLRWEPWGPSSDSQASETAIADRHADRVSEALRLGELAAQLAAPAEGALVATARLLGLLRGGRGWLAIGGESPAGRFDHGATVWWEGLETSSAEPFRTANDVVLRAVASLAGAAEAGLPAAEGERCRRLAIEGRRHWLASEGGCAECLPALADKLGRLHQLESRFNETLEREKLEAMAEFAAGAGHEINNPLTVIAGRAQLFLLEEKDPERRRGLALVNAQAMRVYEMIADMRLFARPPEPERRPTDLAELADRVVREVSARAAEQDTAIRRSGATASLIVDVDPVQWGVALGALCNNALEALGRGGNVEVSVRRVGHQAEIRVADDGPGITPEERRHLFDPFYSARQAGRGLGMGLSKCWRIVTRHGSRIEVQSEPGHGATFVITLETP